MRRYTRLCRRQLLPGTTTTAASAVEVIPFFRALADETRLESVRLLATIDLRVAEIVDYLNLSQNAVTYHLKQLQAVGLLRDHRSSADARDIYYAVGLARLEALYASAGAALHPGIMPQTPPAPLHGQGDPPLRVLFLCTHNSVRSQFAEAITRHLAGDQVEVVCAGSEPAGVHPLTIELLTEWGIGTSALRSKSMNRLPELEQAFDYVITVCDRTARSARHFSESLIRSTGASLTP